MISRCFHTKNTTCKQSRCHDQVKIITKPSSSDVVASLVSGIWTELLGHNSITLWLNHRWLNSRTNMINDLSWFTAVNMPVWDSQKTPKKELEKIPIACAWYVCQCMLLNASNTLAALNDILKYLKAKKQRNKNTTTPHKYIHIYIYSIYIYSLKGWFRMEVPGWYFWIPPRFPNCFFSPVFPNSNNFGPPTWGYDEQIHHRFLYDPWNKHGLLKLYR